MKILRGVSALKKYEKYSKKKPQFSKNTEGGR